MPESDVERVNESSEEYDVIVVGAGIGGATCAALLAKGGARTLLVDKNARPGGKAMVAGREGGFRYDLWPIVGGPSIGSQFAHVLSELGMSDELEILTPSQSNVLLYRGAGSSEYARSVGSSTPDPLGAAQIFGLLGLQPADIPETLRLFQDIGEMSQEEIDKLDQLSFADFISRYRIPQALISYLGMQCNIIFVVPIDQLATSEMIRVLQDFGPGGAGRYHAGGFGRVAEVFCQGVERYGGRVLLGTRVDEIQVEDGAVRGIVTDAGCFRAPVVVSNAGIQPTVLKLVGEDHFDDAYAEYVRKLVPSQAIMGIRYFLDRPFFDHGMYVAFSDENYLDADRFARLESGWLPDDVLVFNTVPAFYDKSLAPEGKQCAVMGTFCAPDPDLAYAEALWQRLDETAKRLWPGMEECIESQTRYGNRQVSDLTRDSVLPGQGGECIGLGQIVGQCGKQKPDAASPIDGLYYVGCDAGGYGCGTHQAADSGVKLAALIGGRVRSSAP
ncbi:MAG: NAD(P)/FAD-dependent oxidoreductase [Deltaproteobacteria bacterium]|nr:NAD(P)/FAD-dependent oxidoreductase [Deltaproteobacteria bacterium]MBW2388920.1 NAD(P)/FAD-dependent oxidoreductase [Deltaproteobacteria bacterium]